MNNNIFPIIVLTGRPASGKSEIIDYLTKLPEEERRRRFHVGRLEILDDFPLLWAWFEEDDILQSRLNKPRLYTDDRGLFLYQYLWDLLIERLSLAYHKQLRDTPDYHTQTTVLIEFSRGTEHGGYARPSLIYPIKSCKPREWSISVCRFRNLFEKTVAGLTPIDRTAFLSTDCRTGN